MVLPLDWLYYAHRKHFLTHTIYIIVDTFHPINKQIGFLATLEYKRPPVNSFLKIIKRSFDICIILFRYSFLKIVVKILIVHFILLWWDKPIIELDCSYDEIKMFYLIIIKLWRKKLFPSVVIWQKHFRSQCMVTICKNKCKNFLHDVVMREINLFCCFHVIKSKRQVLSGELFSTINNTLFFCSQLFSLKYEFLALRM